MNLRAIHTVAMPTLILHGEWDQIIPLSDGRALFEGSGAAKKELVVIPRAGRNDMLWLGRGQDMDAVCRFVKGKAADR
jgi:fermentation-respiration switch protein FrsA (DUF1100 family)